MIRLSWRWQWPVRATIYTRLTAALDYPPPSFNRLLYNLKKSIIPSLEYPPLMRVAILIDPCHALVLTSQMAHACSLADGNWLNDRRDSYSLHSCMLNPISWLNVRAMMMMIMMYHLSNKRKNKCFWFWFVLIDNCSLPWTPACLD